MNLALMLKIHTLTLRKILAYGSDFWVNFVGTIVAQLFIARALWSTIFEGQGITELKGFNLDQFSFYYLAAPIIMKVLMGENVGFISSEIYDGGISKYLLYPLSFFTYKKITYFTYSFFYSLQLFLILSAYVLFFPTALLGLSLMNLAAAILLIGLGTYFIFLVFSTVEMISFWADSVWSLAVILRFVVAFVGGQLLPLTFFPEWAQALLMKTPFPWLIGQPILLIMGRLQWQSIHEGLLVLTIWIFIAHIVQYLFWKRGNLQFTGVGL